MTDNTTIARKAARRKLNLVENLYTSKMSVTAVHVLNDRILPFFEEQGCRVVTILTDNGPRKA